MNWKTPEEGTATPGERIRRGRASPAGRRVASAVACVAAGVLVGAALHRILWQAQAAPALAETGARADGGLLAQAPQDGFAAVAKAVMPAVVNISSLKVTRTYEYSPFMLDPFFRDFFGQELPGMVVPREQREMSLGSGVIVDEDGTILTNYHVIEQSQEVKASLADGRELPARIVGADRRTDLAVLRVGKTSLPHARMGDSERIEVGDIVLAIGNPFGLGETVTMGIISAIGRGRLGLADYEDFIQTDAAINPGNSGGALVNTRGEVIGINTAIYSRSGGYQGIGFAIPSGMARDVLDSIVKFGHVVRGYAGLGFQGITPDLARAFGLSESHGALVTGVDPDGPAAGAGLRRGDVLVTLQGRAIASDVDLRTQLSRLKPGDRAVLEIVRDGRRKDVTLVLSEPPADRGRAGRRG